MSIISNLFRKQPSNIEATGTISRGGQIRFEIDHPFSKYFSGYTPLKFNIQLYDILREAIPYLDIAVLRYVRLIGQVEAESSNKNLQDELNKFINNVHVNFFSNGLENFITQIADSTIARGMGLGELVPNTRLNDVYNLVIGSAETIRFAAKNDVLYLGQSDPLTGVTKIFENQQLIYYTAFDQRNGHPEGYSMFYSLPFVTRIFLRIQHAIENQIWRVGDPTFFSLVKAGSTTNYADAKKAATDLQEQMEQSFKDRRTGNVRDIFAAVPGESDVKIEMIGSGDVMAVEIPSRICLEQILSRTGLPPHLFSLYKWTSTERMSTHQTDVVIGEVNAYRRKLDPIIKRILNTFMALRGLKGEYELSWRAINLLDEESTAKTRMYNSQAMSKEIDSYLKLYDYGLIDDNELYGLVTENGLFDIKKIGFQNKYDFLKAIEEKKNQARVIKMARELLGKSNGNL